MLSSSVMSNSLQPHGLQPPRLLCSWGFSRPEYCNGLPCPSPEDLPNPVKEPRSPAWWAHSLLSEPPGKPKNTGVGSLFHLQGRFPDPGIKPGSPALQADPLPAEPQGKPKNTGVGSLFHLQGNLPDPGIEPGSPALQADSLPTELSGKPTLQGHLQFF